LSGHRITLRISLFALLVFTCSGRFSTSASFTQALPVYRNEEFGIALRYPEGVEPCPAPENEHDHGPLMILDPAFKRRCTFDGGDRVISIFAEYNTLQDAKTLRAFLNRECQSETKKDQRLAPPANLTIPGLRTAAARVNHADGWIDVIVVTQAGKPSPDFDSSVPSYNYDLRLHTLPKYLKQDLRVFRAVLHTIKLDPDNPPSPDSTLPPSSSRAI
jgi:hypothetical protein